MKSKVYIIISFICASLCWLSCNDDENIQAPLLKYCL